MDEMLVILNTAEGGYHHNILIFTNNFFYEECISESDLNKFELYDDMVNYLGNKDGYGWHIADLKIYDKPRELSEFWGRKKLTRPPQSWQYVEELEK